MRQKGFLLKTMAAAIVMLGNALTAWAQCPDGTSVCTVTIACYDMVGDGWNGASILVYQGTTLRGTVTLASGYSGEEDVAVCAGDSVRFVWHSGLYDMETTFDIMNGDGTVIVAGAVGGDYGDGTEIARAAVSCPSCVRPSGLAIHADSVGATAQWSGNGETMWEVTLNGTVAGTTATTSWSFTGLTTNTTYTVGVRAVCGAGDTSEILTRTFRTGCAALELPYFNSFDDETEGALPNCWNGVVTFGSLPRVSHEMAYSDSLSLHFGASEAYNLVSTPLVNVPGNELNVSFRAHLEDGIHIGNTVLFRAWLKVGVMSDPTDSSTFIPYLTIDNQDGQWHEYEFSTTDRSADTQYAVAFLFYGTDMMIGDGNIDDLSISHDSGCPRPLSAGVDSIGGQSARLYWREAGNGAAGYEIRFSTTPNPHNSTLFATVYDTTATLTGLEQSTTYYTWVRTVCADDVMSDYRAFPVFTTSMNCAPLRDVRLVNVGYTAALLGWSYDNLNGGMTEGTTIRVFDHDDLTTPIAEEFATDDHMLVDGLEPSHTYLAELRNTCTVGDASDTANAVQFEFMTLSCSEISSNGTLAGTSYGIGTEMTHAYVQTLYRASEMPPVDTIRAVAFRAYDTFDEAVTIDLYMGNTTQSLLGTGNPIPADTLMLVAQGKRIEAGASGWKIVELDTPFVYDGQHNLAVATHNHSGHFYMNPVAWTFHNTTGTSTAVWNNFAAISPASPTSYFTENHDGAADIRFLTRCAAPECQRPIIVNLEADSTEITVEWRVFGTTAGDPAVQYRPAGQGGYQNASTADNLTATLTGLNAATLYEVRVGVECNGDTLWDVRTVRTTCGRMTVPYMESFDSYANGVMPPCWNYNAALVGHAHGGLFWDEAPTRGTALLPELDEPIENLEINFRALMSSDDAIMVGVSDPHGTHIEWRDTLRDENQGYEGYVWLRHSFEGYTGEGTRIALARMATGYAQTLVDDISVDIANGCTPPTAITAHNLGDASSIIMSWNSTGTATRWETAVDTLGANIDQIVSTQTVSDTFCTLPALQSGKKYTFFVRSVCDDGIYSAWRTAAFAAGSHIMPSNGTDTVTQCGLIIYDDGGMAGNYSNNCHSMLIVRPEDSTQSIAFMGGTVDLSPWGEDILNIYEGEGTSGELLMTTMGTWGPLQVQGPVVSEVGPMTFEFTSNSTVNATGFELFTVCVDRPTCPRPRHLTATATGPSTANISWTGTATQYDLYWRETGSSNWSATSVAGTTYVLTGLNAGTSYEVQVQGRCNGTDLSPMSADASFTTSCLATVISQEQAIEEDFENPEAPATCFTMLKADNNSHNEMTHSTMQAFSGYRSFCFSSFYTANDYNQYLISPMLESRDSVSIRFRYSDYMYGNEKLRVGYSTESSDPDSFVWTDTLTTIGTNWLPYHGDFPAETRYIAIGYFSNYKYYAYIDSLRISVVASADCERPVISDINEDVTSIQLTFNANGAVEAYITDQAWNDNVNGVIVNGNTYTFSGLNEGSDYTVGLRTQCSGGGVSEWVTRRVSTAVADCPPPENFTLENLDYTEATVSWSGDADAFEINVFNTAVNRTYIADGSPYTVTGLAADISYTLKIRPLCGASGRPGAWCNTQLTIHTPVCEPVENVRYSILTDEDGNKKLKVDWEGHADHYEINYGEEHFGTGTGVVINGIEGTTYTIEGLDGQLTYDLYVRAWCNGTVHSIWSNKLTFSLNETGVDRPDNSFDFKISPNPADGQVTLLLNRMEGEVCVSIVDMNGRTVKSERLECSGECSMRIDLGTVASGVYFVRVEDGRHSEVRRLVVK